MNDVNVQLSAVEVSIVQHTDLLADEIASCARSARAAVLDEATQHPLVLETSLTERREVSGTVKDLTVSHTVSVTAGGILVTVLAAGTLTLVRDEPLGEEW